MPRKGIICGMCGGEFFERSFPIHQKACAAKQQHIRLHCQHCNQEVPKLELEKHLARCPKAPKPQTQSQLGKQQTASPGAVSNVFDSSGRLQCAVCGRWFNADRVAKHQAICRTIGQNKRPVFDSFKQRKFDPQIHRAAPSAFVGRSSNLSASSGLAAARSYYSFAPGMRSQSPVSRASSSMAAIRGRGAISRGVFAPLGGRASVSVSSVSSGPRSTNATQRPLDVRHQRTAKAATSLKPPCPSLGPVPFDSRPSPRSPSPSAGRGQGAPVRGPSGGRPPMQPSATMGRSSVSRGRGSPVPFNRGGAGARQPDSSGRFQGRGRGGPPPGMGRISPGNAGTGKGGGGLSTSNVCSPENPFAHPNYPV